MQPSNFCSWNKNQLLEWIKGVHAFNGFQEHFRNADIQGDRLSSLTHSDLSKIGITEAQNQECILDAVQNLIDDFACLDSETLQDILFKIVRSAALIASLVRRLTLNMSCSFHDHLESLDRQREQSTILHTMHQSSLNLKKYSTTAASWLERSPFSMLPQMNALRPFILQCAFDAETLIQCAIKKSQSALLDQIITSVETLRDRLESVIHDCNDSLMLTPCTFQLVKLRKAETVEYGFHFQTTANKIHIIQSVTPEGPASCFGNLAKDDEIIEVNNQTVLEWEYQAVLGLIENNNRRLELGIRKRPSHSIDFLGYPGVRRRQCFRTPRFLTPLPQHSRRSIFILSRIPKRRQTAVILTPSIDSSTQYSDQKDRQSESKQLELNSTCIQDSMLPLDHLLTNPIVEPSTNRNSNSWRNFESTISKKDVQVKIEISDSEKIDCQDDISNSSVERFKKSNHRVSKKIDCRGWLWMKKCSSFSNKYVKRWCVFKHNTLYYHRYSKIDFAEGLILLAGFTITPFVESRYGRFPFRIYNEWAQYVFAASTEQLRAKWMNLLGLASICYSASLPTSPKSKANNTDPVAGDLDEASDNDLLETKMQVCSLNLVNSTSEATSLRISSESGSIFDATDACDYVQHMSNVSLNQCTGVAHRNRNFTDGSAPLIDEIMKLPKKTRTSTDLLIDDHNSSLSKPSLTQSKLSI